MGKENDGSITKKGGENGKKEQQHLTEQLKCLYESNMAKLSG